MIKPYNRFFYTHFISQDGIEYLEKEDFKNFIKVREEEIKEKLIKLIS